MQVLGQSITAMQVLRTWGKRGGVCLMSQEIVFFLKEVTQNIRENQQANHEQINTKHETLKRSLLFV